MSSRLQPFALGMLTLAFVSPEEVGARVVGLPCPGGAWVRGPVIECQQTGKPANQKPGNTVCQQNSKPECWQSCGPRIAGQSSGHDRARYPF